MAKSRVSMSNQFPRHRDQLDRGFQEGLAAGGKIAARKAEEQPHSYRIDQIMRTGLVGVQRTRKGFAVTIGAPDSRSLFFEKGTRGKKGAAKRRSTKAVEGGRGIKPQRFLKKGLKAAEPEIEQAIKRALQ